MRALWIGLIMASAYMIMLVLCLSILAGAVELHISGSISGSGNQSLVLVGDNLSAWWNGTAFNATAVSV